MDDGSLWRNCATGKSASYFSFIPVAGFTALENVMFPALIQGMDAAQARKQAGELLELVGLKDRLTHRPGKLSGGEQQRVAVARAVVLQPKLILADEPTGSLDVRIGEEVQALLFRLNRKESPWWLPPTIASLPRKSAEGRG
jgi:lipoprotein-releasing system ATP-binding protein